MPEDIKRITIGAEYRDTFADLVKVLSSGQLENTGARIEVGADGKPHICTGAAEYVYDDKADAAANGGSAAVAMRGDGATWFAPVRKGNTFDDGTSEWKQLIYKTARDFHDRFSIIEYKRCDGSGNTDAGEVENNVNKIVDRLFGKRNAAVIKGNDKEKGSEDIYGASVKLELSGTGQSHYVVMCKIYFRRTSSGVTPLTSAEALQINSRLEEAQDNDDPVRLTADESANINNVTVNAVRELVNGNYPISFKESLCFSTRQVVNPETGKREDNYDLKTYKYLASRAHSNNAPVTCTGIQVLSISHVEWINDYYEIAFGGKVVMQAVVGFGGSITLRCVNCGGANLVTSNAISYVVTDDEGEKHRVNVTLNYSKEDLGVDDELLEEIKAYSEIKNHLFEVKCGKNIRMGKPCSCCVCRSQTVYLDGEMKCADCPYPEVVYTDYSGDRPIRYLTEKMTFVNDRLAMTLSENAAKCRGCGRSFTNEALTGGLCKLCSETDDVGGERGERAKKLYSKYRNAFPHTVRIRHLLDKKYCFEDDTALMFALGNEKYYISKLDFKDEGFVPRPKKVN